MKRKRAIVGQESYDKIFSWGVLNKAVNKWGTVTFNSSLEAYIKNRREN